MVVQVTRSRAKKQPAEVRRETVLEAAIRVFAHAPYHSAGTAAIAREAGIAEPTIYRHFESKRELYLAAIERTATGILDAWRGIAAQIDNGYEALQALGEWYGLNVMSNPDYLRLRHRAAAEAEDDVVREKLRWGYGEIHALLVAVIRRGQQQGLFRREADADGAAWLFIGVGLMLDLSVITGLDPAAQPGCKDMLGATFMQILLTPDVWARECGPESEHVKAAIAARALQIVS